MGEKQTQINVWSGLALKIHFKVLCKYLGAGDVGATCCQECQGRAVIACVCVSRVMLRKVKAIMQGCVAI